METSEILNEINSMSISNRMYIIEMAIRSIRNAENVGNLTEAANLLYSDYSNDKNLTTFTDLDFEDFYETK